MKNFLNIFKKIILIFFKFFSIIFQQIKFFFQKIPKAFRIMGKLEKIILFIFLIIFIVFLGIKTRKIYFDNTIEAPVLGGKMVIGSIEAPTTLNPIFAEKDIEKTISGMIFSPLLKVKDDGSVDKILIDDYSISSGGRIYTFHLSEKCKWHDQKAVSSEDIIYTFSIIQSKQYKGIYKNILKDVMFEAVDEKTIKIILPNPYEQFLSSLDIKILPSHILGTEPLEKLKSAEFNLNPIGCGSYKIKSSSLENGSKKIILERFKNVLKPSKIKYVDFIFYNNYSELKVSYEKNKIDSIFKIPNNEVQPTQEFALKSEVYSNLVSGYNVLHLNFKNEILQYKDIRQAINFATDRQEIIEKVYFNNAAQASGPVPKGSIYFQDNKNEYSLKKAKELISNLKWKDSDNDGYFDKNGMILEFKLVSTDSENMKQAAKILKTQYKKVGIKINTIFAQPEILQTVYLNNKNYDLLLIGESLGINLDLYPYWHSSQKTKNGFNFSEFEDSEIDQLLEEIRNMKTQKEKKEKFIKIQNIFSDRNPAIFLTQPMVKFAISKDIKNVHTELLEEPAGFFNNIYFWYAKVGRAKK